jgi:NAD(P)-dependent dehydrogenase (short-subunit alcohol dehydrogenase family)
MRTVVPRRPPLRSNVTSVMWLTSLFLALAHDPAVVTPAAHGAGVLGGDSVPPCCIINVSSLAAVKPFPTQGRYCTGKAARDMWMAVVAEEEAPLGQVSPDG